MGASLIPMDAMGPSKYHGTTMNQVLYKVIHCDFWWKFPPKNLVFFFLISLKWYKVWVSFPSKNYITKNCEWNFQQPFFLCFGSPFPSSLHFWLTSSMQVFWEEIKNEGHKETNHYKVCYRCAFWGWVPHSQLFSALWSTVDFYNGLCVLPKEASLIQRTMCLKSLNHNSSIIVSTGLP